MAAICARAQGTNGMEAQVDTCKSGVDPTVLGIDAVLVDTVPSPDEYIKDEPFAQVEVMPQFPSGIGELQKYLAASLKYPETHLETDVQGRMVVQFIVERDGSITNIHVIRSLGSAFDKEAVRVVKNMPRWIPGSLSGQPVRVRYIQPIMFRVSN